ncbi:hypothetical protein LTR41_011249 [Exophiala xenobiotica]|nr:hypothetical protein LTR41_011249 [Exophiala xenobiotica]
MLIRWGTRAVKGIPPDSQTLAYSPLNSWESTLAINERRALDYFKARLWPLLSAVSGPFAPPGFLAIQSRTILSTTCLLADAHRRISDKRNSDRNLQQSRLGCFETVRRELASADLNKLSLVNLLVAILLLYFLDGFVESLQPSASTESHHAGAMAVIASLGGFEYALIGPQNEMSMLLSEFASTDLTSVLLHGKRLCLPASIWNHIEEGAVWWPKETFGTQSLASIFGTMARMAEYRQSLQEGAAPFAMERIRDFEQKLQPSYDCLMNDDIEEEQERNVDESVVRAKLQSHALCRAFQHSAFINLYRAICNLPSNHSLVQQHVESCRECIKGMSNQDKIHNCAIFPLLITGAHTFIEEEQHFISERLDSIYRIIKFEAVLSVKTALQNLWGTISQYATWNDMFGGLAQAALVL